VLECLGLTPENALALIRMAELENAATAAGEADPEVLIAFALELAPTAADAIGFGCEGRERGHG
jgi:hypothetical protein